MQQLFGKVRYVVPAIKPMRTYITEFENMDIAVGFSNMEEIAQYIGVPDEEKLEYDFVLIDIDNMKGLYNFKLQEVDKNYFVTAFDVYSLKRGLEIFAGLERQINLTKVYFSKEMLKEEDDYLNFLSLGYKIVWNEYKIYFPIENGDLSVIYENQRVEKIRFKKLSVQYKDSLAYLAEEILGDVSENIIRKTIKFIEKGA